MARDKDEKKTEKPTNGRVPGYILATEKDYKAAIQAEKELPDNVQGVLLKAKLDPDHWMSAGVDETVNALVSGRTIFSPITFDKGRNPAVYMSADRVLASGYIWEESRQQIAYKPLVVVQSHGRGLAIGFTADPNYRAYMDGLNILFLNAVFRGPAHASPQVTETLYD